MNIKEALKPTGKARDIIKSRYIKIHEHIPYWYKIDGTRTIPVALDIVLGDFWQPYYPPKCTCGIENR